MSRSKKEPSIWHSGSILLFFFPSKALAFLDPDVCSAFEGGLSLAVSVASIIVGSGEDEEKQAAARDFTLEQTSNLGLVPMRGGWVGQSVKLLTYYFK